jgi:hypothetical protein
VQDGEIPRTSEGPTRQGKAGDCDTLIKMTPENLLFKVLGVSQRKIRHSEEMCCRVEIENP